MDAPRISKYPRTYHIEGSRLQPGDEGLDFIPFKEVKGRPLVVEEKMDGANSAVSFTADGTLLLQSRGHYLTGGAREKHFNLFKQWGAAHAYSFWPVLGARYIMYGEWLYARHTMFYNALPHYFMEFDILDRETGDFLSTERRHEMLAGLPVVPVKVLKSGPFDTLEQLTGLVGHSYFIRDGHLDELHALASRLGFDPDRAVAESDPDTTMEGLYIKLEEDGVVKERLKYVRSAFTTRVVESESHWLSRPIIPNQLAEGVDIFASSI